MNINNNFNVLPWYYSADQQNANKWYAYGNIWPLVSSNSQLIPFQLVIDKPVTTIGTIKVHTLADGQVIDSGLKPISLPASDASYTILSLITNTLPSALTEGRYYCSMNIDGTDIYSEVFTVVPDLSKYIKVTYWNEDKLVYKGGAIDYSNGFKYYMYICSDVAKPEYPFEEELTKRAGYKFLESQISSKLYKFTFVAPEFICDAMRLIRLNDYIQVESRGQKYNALNFTYNPKWEEQGDLASVECEFETDNIIQKLESFNRRQQESFYNALLANANDTILFDAGVVAQYYKDSQATELVEGKLIRELDEALIIDAPSYIPVDNGIGAAKKLDLKTILAKYAIKTEVYESLAAKWTYDNERATKWDKAATDSHTHVNKSALDLIAYDAAKKTWRFTGNIALSGVVSMYADLGDLDIPSIYAGLPIDNRTIKRDALGMLYSVSGGGSDFDKTAMWAALASTTTEQINKAHLTEALSTYVLNTDSRLSDSRNAADVYAWAKQPNPPTVDLSNYVDKSSPQIISGQKTFTNAIFLNHSALADDACSISLYTKESGGQGLNIRSLLVAADYSYRPYVPDQGAYFAGVVKADSFIKHGGLSSQFLKADGSVDSKAYVTIYHDHSYVRTEDYRDRNPVGFSNQTFTPFFLSGSKIGTGSYYDAMYLNTYSDNSGGKTNLIAMSKQNGRMYRMMVDQGAAAWNGTLVEMLDTNNWQSTIDGRYLLLTGGILSGPLSLNGNRLQTSPNTYLFGSDGYHQFNTSYGNIQIGPMNEGHAHIYTDRPNFYFNKALKILGHDVWHAGNDGTGSGLDADLLDGYHIDNVLAYKGTLHSNVDYNALLSPACYFNQIGNGTSNANYHLTYGVDLVFGGAAYISQLQHGANNSSLVIRQRWDGVWSSWRSIAFEDGNIESASKLRMPRKIFGQTFDGSSDISGAMSGVRSIGGESNASIDYITSAGHHFYTNSGTVRRMAILGNGDVGIGTANPVYKLDVYGNIRSTSTSYFDGKIIVDRGRYALSANPSISLAIGDTDTGFDWASDGVYKIKSDGIDIAQVSQDRFHLYKKLVIESNEGNYCEGIRIKASSSNWVTIALGAAGEFGTSENMWSIHRTYENNFAIARNGSSGVNGMFIDKNGNVGFGTVTPTCKMEIHGAIKAVNGVITTNAEVYAGDAIWTDGRIFAGYDSGIAGSVSCSNWFRSSGPTGWFNRTYGGGIYMEDNDWVRVYNSKKFAVDNIEADSIWTKGGIKAEGTTIQLGSIKMIVNAAAKSIRFEMADGTPCNVVSSGGVVMYGN